MSSVHPESLAQHQLVTNALAHSIDELRAAVTLLAHYVTRQPRSWQDDIDLAKAWPNPADSEGPSTVAPRTLEIWNSYTVSVNVYAGPLPSNLTVARPLVHVPPLTAVRMSAPATGLGDKLYLLASAQPATTALPLRVIRYEHELAGGVWPIGDTGFPVFPAAGVVWDVSDRQARLLGRTVEQGGIADTLMTAGQVTSPAAGAAIATIAAPGAGVYSVQIVTFVTGTAESAAKAANMQLQHGATAVGALLCSTATPVPMTRERLTVLAAEAVTVNAIAIATAGSVYNAALAVTQIA